jgi:hypothetical protein
MDMREIAKKQHHRTPYMFHSNLDLNVALMKMGKHVDVPLKKKLNEKVLLGMATDEESMSSVLGLSVGLSKFPSKVNVTELVRVGGYNLLEIALLGSTRACLCVARLLPYHYPCIALCGFGQCDDEGDGWPSMADLIWRLSRHENATPDHSRSCQFHNIKLQLYY